MLSAHAGEPVYTPNLAGPEVLALQAGSHAFPVKITGNMKQNFRAVLQVAA